MQSNFFPAFPSNFFPAPFISMPGHANGSHYSGVMSWSEEYACHNNEQPGPFSRSCLNA